MSIFFKLLLFFAKLSLITFGGGYIIIPNLIKAAQLNNWASISDTANIISVAGMAPGPVAVNAAIGFGYKTGGIWGALAGFLGIVVPCAVIVIIAAGFFNKIYNNPTFKSVLYGLSPVVTGIILFASVSLALKNGMINAVSDNLIKNGFYISMLGHKIFELKSILLTLAAFVFLIKTKVKPVFLIIAGGIIGVLLF